MLIWLTPMIVFKAYTPLDCYTDKYLIKVVLNQNHF